MDAKIQAVGLTGLAVALVLVLRADTTNAEPSSVSTSTSDADSGHGELVQDPVVDEGRLAAERAAKALRLRALRLFGTLRKKPWPSSREQLAAELDTVMAEAKALQSTNPALLTLDTYEFLGLSTSNLGDQDGDLAVRAAKVATLHREHRERNPGQS
ncbi:MAG: hypothetical protein MUC36_11310, partial [Planctomycetes bacterium]|nr:hypothetical protein [Planctomycetota bacterium]